MRAGALKNRITFEEPVVTQGSTGQESITWTEFATVWGSVAPMRGRVGGKEEMAGNQPLAELNTLITIRWSPNNDLITEKWRAVHLGVYYDIKEIAHVNLDQRMIELMCRSGLNNG